MNINEEVNMFYQWIKLKIRRHFRRSIPTIREGDIWWAAVGKNVGIEINGKNVDFSRPVLVYKKLSRLGFLAIPLTTQPHEGDWYIPFEFQNKTSRAVLSQIRVLSVYRLYTRMGRLSAGDFTLIKKGFMNLYGK